MSYKRAIGWIAINDEPTLLDPNELKDLMTVLLVADLYNKAPIVVATDIFILRTNKEENKA